MTMWNDNEVCTDQFFVGIDDPLYGLLVDISLDGPSCEDTAFLEDLLDFLRSSLSCFWETKEDVDACRKVKRGENKISLISNLYQTRMILHSKQQASTYLPCDSRQAGWYGPGKSKVKCPVCRADV